MDLSAIQVRRTLRILVRTMPILLVRLGVFGLFGLAMVVYFAVFGALAWLLAMLHPLVALLALLLALGGAVPLTQLAKQYLLYMIQAAHIAVIAELLAGRELPPGSNQLQWGKDQVVARFGDINIMFVADNLVRAIVRRFSAMVTRAIGFLPGGAGRNLSHVVRRVIQFATDYIDEAILARAFWEREQNMWKATKEGVILYAMVWKPLLINAVVLMLLSYLPAVVLVALVVVPAGLLIALVSQPLAGGAVLVMLILAWVVKLAVGDAFAMISMIAAYRDATQGLEPDPAFEYQLEQASDKFRELKERALEHTTHQAPTETGETTRGQQGNQPEVHSTESGPARTEQTDGPPMPESQTPD